MVSKVSTDAWAVLHNMVCSWHMTQYVDPCVRTWIYSNGPHVNNMAWPFGLRYSIP